MLQPRSHPFPPAVDVRRWQASDALAPVEEADAVVNLVDSPIFGKRWTPARKQELIQTRRLSTRSLVEGGVLAGLLPLYRGGLGGTLGPGGQWFSWIHVNDATRLILHAFDHETIAGPLISASPNAVTSRDFARIFAHAVGRPRLFPMSSLMMELVWGERAALFLDSHRMVPHMALSTGFQFRFPTLEVALSDLLGKRPLQRV
jgi:NAD dependent epimerase/dehydratase family enzyme